MYHILTLFLVMTGSQQIAGNKLSKCTYTNMLAMFSIAVYKEKKNTDERKLHGSLHEDYSVERSSDAVQMSVVPSNKTTNTKNSLKAAKNQSTTLVINLIGKSCSRVGNRPAWTRNVCDRKSQIRFVTSHVL